MKASSMNKAIWKIMTGLFLLAFYLMVVAYDQAAWNRTFLGNVLSFRPDPLMLHMITLGLVVFLTSELHLMTLGQSKGRMSVVMTLGVLIVAVVIGILTGLVADIFQSPVRDGVTSIVLGMDERSLDDVLSDTLLVFTGAFVHLYAATAILYLYQIKKMKLKLSIFQFVRVLLVVLAALVLMTLSGPFVSAEKLILSSVVLVFQFAVYKRTRYSLAAFSLVGLVALVL
jgi:hypothetical protein